MSLKDKTITGVKWSAFNSFATQIVGFIISIVLARLLSPSDYGITGMVGIFFGISGVFIGGGFGAALVRKKDRTREDYSTVFYYNVGMSLLFYILLFLIAPWIAQFYKMPILIPITRVSALGVIFGALGGVQASQFSIKLDFKTPTKVAIISLSISGTIGIILAFLKFGVWALVFQGLISSLTTTILYWIYSSWKPLPLFSKKSFTYLFGFGSKLMVTSLMDVVYMNAFPLIVGKFFSASQLGLYTRSESLAQLPATTITGIVQKVTFPVLSEIQDDNERLAVNYRRIIRTVSFIVFPCMFMLAVLAKPLVQVLLSDKWLPAVPYLIILCFNWVLFPVHVINLNLLQVKGRSDLFLKIEVVKKVLFIVVIVCSVPFGLMGMCIGRVFTSFMGLFIHTYYTERLINLGVWKQLKDISPIYLISIISAIVSYFSLLLTDIPFVQLLVGGLVYGGIYLFTAYVFNMSELVELFKILFKKDISNLRTKFSLKLNT